MSQICCDAILRAFERRDGRDLDRREGAVVEVALDARERADQVAVADHEADAPAGHVVALRQGEELDRDVLRARHLHDRRRLVAVEDDVGIGEVVHDDRCRARAAERDDALEEVAGRRTARSDSPGKLRISIFGFGSHARGSLLELGEEVDAGSCIGTERMSRAGDDRAVDVDRIAGIGHQHRVAAVERGEAAGGRCLPSSRW